MNRRQFGGAVATLVLGISTVRPVTAGGWATIQIEEPIEDVVTGDVVALNFTVRQHGETLVDYDDVHVTATHAESKTSIVVRGASTGEVGHYRADITFNEPGRWKLEAMIQGFGIKSSFPTLYVRYAESEPDDADSTQTETSDVVDVDIIGFGFSPALIEVAAGTTVRWTNHDPIKHEVAFVDPAIDDSGILDTSESFSFTFDAPGKYTFVCGPHPGMSGLVVVTE